VVSVKNTAEYTALAELYAKPDWITLRIISKS
jgi:hypothetical protein